MRRFLLLTMLTSAAWAEDGGTKARRTVADVSLLLFTSPTCASCKRLEAQGVLATVQKQVPGLRLEALDVETHEAAVTRYGVEVTPTLILVDREGFPLGRPLISLDDPSGTAARIEKLVRKMTGG